MVDRPKPPPSYMMYEGSDKRIPVHRDSDGEPVSVQFDAKRRRARKDNRRNVRHG